MSFGVIVFFFLRTFIKWYGGSTSSKIFLDVLLISHSDMLLVLEGFQALSVGQAGRPS